MIFGKRANNAMSIILDGENKEFYGFLISTYKIPHVAIKIFSWYSEVRFH